MRLLQDMVPESEQARISGLAEEELITLHFRLGTWIRNNRGLWHDNQQLVTAAGCESADDASAIIIREFWVALRGEGPKVH